MLSHIRHTDCIRIDELTHAADELLGANVLRLFPAERMRALAAAFRERIGARPVAAL